MIAPTTQAPRRAPTQVLAAAAMLIALAVGAGCSSMAVQPSSGSQGASIAGTWQRDAASSDNFEAKLAVLLRERQQRLRARHGMGGGYRNGDDGEGGYRSRDPRDIDMLRLPQEASEQFRRRMVDDLSPAQQLRITSEGNGEAIIVTLDAESTGRRYLPGQRVSRIDDSGAAQISCGWEDNTFVVHAAYVHNATRSWRYEVEPATGMLLLRFEVNDPEIGKLTLASRYRRQSL